MLYIFAVAFGLSLQDTVIG